MTQDEMKKAVGWAALSYVQPDTIIGVGTGSTVNCFIDALASIKDQIKAAVSSSEASTERLKALDADGVDGEGRGPVRDPQADGRGCALSERAHDGG